MFDETAYKLQCNQCLDLKIRDELQRRNRALRQYKAEYRVWADGRDIVAWEAAREELDLRFQALPDGESPERAAILAEANSDLPPMRPHPDYPIASITFHAQLQPFQPADELTIITDVDGLTRVSCPDCGAVLLTHGPEGD